MHIGEEILLVNKTFCESQLAEHKVSTSVLVLNSNLEIIDIRQQWANHTVKSTIHSQCLYMLFSQ